MPLVSVIIPIYNTEKFLPLCINSVLNQTLTDIEVLLVNDGSTDGSGKICDEYACKDQRIQVIHTLNQGVSHARNQGLETAKGEYIAFMDSDDWIETDMIATLYQLIRTNEAGLATCGYIIENEDGRPIYHINEVKSGKLTQWARKCISRTRIMGRQIRASDFPIAISCPVISINRSFMRFIQHRHTSYDHHLRPFF